MQLAEGDIVDLGDRRFRVLHLPGHSPDSIGLLDERDGIFFSGDAIYDDTLIDDLPDSDRAAYRATMARIIELPVRIAHGGHGESFSGERMREIARALHRARAGMSVERWPCPRRGAAPNLPSDRAWRRRRMTLFLAFIGVSLVMIITPGPDTAITIRNTLFGGRAGGIFTALGVASGLTIWAVATSAGIVALLVASEPLFLAVKYAGAAYLVFLGIHALREAIWPAGEREGQAADGRLRPAPETARSAFRQGLISDLGNPKIAVFFASLLPQFVPSGAATFLAPVARRRVRADNVRLAYALCDVVAKAGDLLRRPRIRRAIEGVTGTLLIGLGIRIAAEQR